MAHTVLDDWKILPRLMMLAVTILTAQSGLVSVCMGALTGCFGIWMGKESKTSITQTQTSSKVEYDVDK
jgi:ABC-type microcin C transport system permease subunit YejE